MEQETLVERAKKIKTANVITGMDEGVIELAIAWAKGEVTLGQCSRAMYDKPSSKGTGGNILYKFAVAFRELYRQGRLIIK